MILWEDLDHPIERVLKTLAAIQKKYGPVHMFSGNAESETRNEDGETRELPYQGVGVIIPFGDLPELKAYQEAKAVHRACVSKTYDVPSTWHTSYVEAKAIVKRLKGKKSLTEAEAALLKSCEAECDLTDSTHGALEDATESLDGAKEALKLAIRKIREGMKQEFAKGCSSYTPAMEDEVLAELGVTEEPKPY